MLKWLSTLLGSEQSPLGRAREQGVEAFTEQFCSGDIWFFSLPPNAGADAPAPASVEEALAVVEGAAHDLADRTSFELFSYSAPDGAVTLPLFTSEKTASLFAQAYVNEVRRMIPFEGVCIPGSSLAAGLGGYATVLIDPRTPGEMRLSEAEVRSIIARAA